MSLDVFELLLPPEKEAGQWRKIVFHGELTGKTVLNDAKAYVIIKIANVPYVLTKYKGNEYEIKDSDGCVYEIETATKDSLPIHNIDLALGETIESTAIEIVGAVADAFGVEGFAFTKEQDLRAKISEILYMEFSEEKNEN